MRPIDGDALEVQMTEHYRELIEENGFYDQYNMGYHDAIHAVIHAEAIPPVVRCKDCANKWVATGALPYQTRGDLYCIRWGCALVERDDYCSYGELEADND